MTQIPKANPVHTEREKAFQLLHQDQTAYAKFCLKIRDKLSKIVPLEYNKAQLYVHQKLEEQKAKLGFVRAVIMKGRQEGVTTYIESRFFKKTSLGRGVASFILSHEAKSTGAIFDMVKRFHDNLPPGMAPPLATANKNQLKFAEIDSEYTVGTAGSEQVGRSMTIKLLHMSEVAFYDHTDELETGLMQAVADMPGTEIILESTANGIGNMFHEYAMQALAGVGLYQLIFVPWYWQDEYRLKPVEGFALTEEESKLVQTYGLDDEQVYWRRMKIAGKKRGLSKFQQEYPFTPEEAFLMSGDPFFSKEHISNARKCNATSPGAPRIGAFDCGRVNDRSVIGHRQGRAVLNYDVHKDLRADGREPTQQLISIAIAYIEKHKLDKLFIDWGYGHGVIDGLITLGYKDIVMGIHFGQAPIKKDRYLNKRAEMYGDARDWLEEPNVNIPDDDIFCFDLLLTPHEKETPTNRMFLPKKTEIKAKAKVSPDITDMFVLTFAFPVRYVRQDGDPAHRSQRRRQGGAPRKSSLTTINRLRQK